jgi:uncharacterized protein (TIGR01777 family)
MKAAISGGTGFIGKHIIDLLESLGYEIILVGRSDITGETSLLKEKLKNASLVINLAGAPIIERWNDEYKKLMYESRIITTRNLVYAMNPATVRLFISASAVGIYSDKGNQTEDSFTYADDYLASICKEWEAEAIRLSGKIRTVIFRVGVVMGKGGGALQKMLPLFRFGLGGVIGNGKQASSWVHINDVIGVFSFVMEHEECEGIYNLTAPNPVSNRIFTQTLAATLKKKAFLPVPEFFLKWIFGEGAIALLKGQTVLPERLISAGYTFQFPDISSALQDIVHSNPESN